MNTDMPLDTLISAIYAELNPWLYTKSDKISLSPNLKTPYICLNPVRDRVRILDKNNCGDQMFLSISPLCQYRFKDEKTAKQSEAGLRTGRTVYAEFICGHSS